MPVSHKKGNEWSEKNLWSDGWGRAGSGVARNPMKDNSREVKLLRWEDTGAHWFYHFSKWNCILLECFLHHFCSACVLCPFSGFGRFPPWRGELLYIDRMWKERCIKSFQGPGMSPAWQHYSRDVLCTVSCTSHCFHTGHNLCRSDWKFCINHRLAR